MIRVILSDRTGNNLFQYAAGRSLAKLHNTKLVLDTAWTDPKRIPQIEEILRLNLACCYEKKYVYLKQKLKKAFKVTPWQFHRCNGYREPGAIPDPNFYKQPDETVISGFFQSPFYFSNIKNEIRNELNIFDIIITEDSKYVEEKLLRHNTVSLHVRRGDYVTIPGTQCLRKDYYNNAINYFHNHYDNIRFCVFSDDIEWCKNVFCGKQFMYCDLEESRQSALHDLRLMSRCKHHIIANSTYSWWGAWLNPDLQKKIIAPRFWMKNLESTSVIEDGWITM